MEEVEETYANCPDCLAREQKTGPFEWQPPVTDAVMVRNWPGVTARTPFKHIVDVGNVIVKYEIPENQIVECSLNGHEHRYGHIAMTRCDLIVRQGSTCAKNSLRGMDKAMEFFHEHEQHSRRIDLIRRYPTESLEILTQRYPRLESYDAYQRIHENGVEGQVMRRRLRMGIARGSIVMVRVPYESTTTRTNFKYEDFTLKGLKFWKVDFNPIGCLNYIEEAKDLVQRAGKLDLKDREAAKALAERCNVLSDNTRRIAEVVAIGDEYFIPSNRKLVDAAINMRWAS